VIELDSPVNLPDGTEVEITVVERSYKNAWNRQKNLMKQGFSMEQRRKIQRDEIHERK